MRQLCRRAPLSQGLHSEEATLHIKKFVSQHPVASNTEEGPEKGHAVGQRSSSAGGIPSPNISCARIFLPKPCPWSRATNIKTLMGPLAFRKVYMSFGKGDLSCKSKQTEAAASVVSQPIYSKRRITTGP